MRFWRKDSFLVVAGVVSLTGALGCGGPPLLAHGPSPGLVPEVALKPGDAVRVDIWKEPTLTGEFRVSPKGTVVFPLLGEREVAEKVPSQVETELAAEYRRYLENPSVKVTALRRIAILGEVRLPSLYMVDATVTLTEALAMAGGLSPAGNKDDIRLVRNGQVLVRSLDADRVVGATPIQSGDQILVGQKSWAARNVNLILGTATSLTISTLYVLLRR